MTSNSASGVAGDERAADGDQRERGGGGREVDDGVVEEARHV
jgi:hypothetical protein